MLSSNVLPSLSKYHSCITEPHNVALHKRFFLQLNMYVLFMNVYAPHGHTPSTPPPPPCPPTPLSVVVVVIQVHLWETGKRLSHLPKVSLKEKLKVFHHQPRHHVAEKTTDLDRVGVFDAIAFKCASIQHWTVWCG